MCFRTVRNSKHIQKCLAFHLKQQIFICSNEIYKDCTCSLKKIPILSFLIWHCANLYGLSWDVSCPKELEPETTFVTAHSLAPSHAVLWFKYQVWKVLIFGNYTELRENVFQQWADRQTANDSAIHLFVPQHYSGVKSLHEISDLSYFIFLNRSVIHVSEKAIGFYRRRRVEFLEKRLWWTSRTNFGKLRISPQLLQLQESWSGTVSVKLPILWFDTEVVFL